MRHSLAILAILTLMQLCGCFTTGVRMSFRPKSATTLELRVVDGKSTKPELEWRILSGHDFLAMGVSNMDLGAHECPELALFAYWYKESTVLANFPLSHDQFTPSVISHRKRAGRGLGSCDVAVIGMHGPGPEYKKSVVFLAAIDAHGSELSRELLLDPPNIPHWAWPLFLPAVVLDVATLPIQLIIVLIYGGAGP